MPVPMRTPGREPRNRRIGYIIVNGGAKSVQKAE